MAIYKFKTFDRQLIWNDEAVLFSLVPNIRGFLYDSNMVIDFSNRKYPCEESSRDCELFYSMWLFFFRDNLNEILGNQRVFLWPTQLDRLFNVRGI